MLKRAKLSNRILSICLAAATLISGLQLSTVKVEAADNQLTLSQAKSLAVANSDAIDSVEAKIMTQEAKLKSAVKKISLKQKNRSTFRYSPLLSFKFPTQASGSTLYDETISPIQIQTQIDTLNHQLNDKKLEEYKKVSELFVTIVSMQDKIDFNNKRVAAYQETIKKNKARLLMGQAKQSDIDTMEAKVKEINTTISNDTSKLETAKKKLSKAIGIDVSTGYTFENPYLKSEIPRSVLKDLQQFTLDNDQSYFDACIKETEGKTAVTTYSGILKNNFSGKYNTISPYIEQALAGKPVQKKSFKTAYDSFLQQIDAPWQGDYKINLLFFSIKIPKEWFKGEVDGIRYIDEDPYAMMDVALDYVDKRLTKEQTETAVLEQVEDQFNTYVSSRKAYLNYVSLVDDARDKLNKDATSNRIGELTYEEYQSSQDSYETLESDMLQSLADYSNSLIEFDRLTCGGVSSYLSGNGVNVFAAGSGTSYIDEEVVNGAYCYVQPIAKQQAFVMTVVIPKDSEVQVTDFELYINKIKVGDKTKVDKQLRHLWVDTQNTNNNAFLRLYNGEDAICDCPIDPSQYSNALKIITDYKVTSKDDNTVGSFSIKTSAIGHYTTLTVTIDEREQVAAYRMKLGDKYINGQSKIDVKKELKYLGLLSESMDDITLEYFDKSGNLLYTGYFDKVNQKLKKDLE